LSIFELRENWSRNVILLFWGLKKLYFCVYRELARYVEKTKILVTGHTLCSLVIKGHEFSQLTAASK